MNRRSFLKSSCLAAIGLAANRGEAASAKVDPVLSIVVDPADQLASAPASLWAVSELKAALEAKGVNARVVPNLESVPANDFCVIVSGSAALLTRNALKNLDIAVPSSAESLVLADVKTGTRAALLACGSDVRGLIYAVTELADRVRFARVSFADVLHALAVPKPVVEQPANPIRSIMRSFVSEVEDKPWYYDREYWKQYLSMLAAQRVNRFNLALGIGYNSARDVTDGYFVFPYPSFVAVPGYDVRVNGLSGQERERNLEMLRFIGNEAAARGLEFQLGLWTHAFEWPASPHANYVVHGLTAETHAFYCRDGLAALLQACPAITGLTLRVHGESGIPDGSFSFWKTLFEAITHCGRRIEIDMHAKSLPEQTLDLALATGMPVNLSPKYWGEHMGLPYHQAAIRDLEMEPADKIHEQESGLSGGSRKFTRYGYADLLAENRRYGVLHRIWPGTRRFLLSGDPATASGYGRNSSFCGSLGVELCEPLSFKGRKGTGLPGGRCAYADKSLNPAYDFEKYLYTYRVWGRLIYNPGADPEVWRRFLRSKLQTAAEPAELALGHASRILPLITTAHGVSANNTIYWPEIYTNMPVVDANRKHPYTDTPSPKRFGTVSPFDPQLFSVIDEFADSLLESGISVKYSPLEVAQWLEELARLSSENLTRAATMAASKSMPELRRLAEDVRIQNAIGLFFAGKMRSAVLWRIYDRTGDRGALQKALTAYRGARRTWAQMAKNARAVYLADITYGGASNRGNWLDRLAAIDADIADMEKHLESRTDTAKAPAVKAEDMERIQKAVRTALAPVSRPSVACRHTSPPSFQPGEPFAVELICDQSAADLVRLQFRHVNQAERWQAASMTFADGKFHATIPASYSHSKYPLQYYFEIMKSDSSLLYPGFDADLANLPYYVVRSAAR